MDFINDFKELINYIRNHHEFLESCILIGLIWLGRLLWLRFQFRHHKNKNQKNQKIELEVEEKRRLVVSSRNFAFLLCILGLFGVWAAQIQHFALSMVAVAAAIVIATKELIMCLLGSLLRAMTKQYSVSDFIEINHIRGRVIDINWLNTLVMQIGPNEQIGRLSGKTVSFPNSLLLSAPLFRDNILGNYVVHLFEIPVPIHLDSDAIVPRLERVLFYKTNHYVDEISAYFEEVQLQKLFITPAAQATIARVPFDDKVYKLVVRFASPLSWRLNIQQAVLDEFMRVQYKLLNNIPLESNTHTNIDSDKEDILLPHFTDKIN